MSDTQPTPDLRPAATYLANVTKDRLTYQRCGECSAAVFYPRLVCPKCGSTQLQLQISAGAGTVYSVSVLPRRDKAALVVGLIDLDEGFRMMSNLVGEDAASAAIGDRVHATFDHDSEPSRVVFITGAAHA